MSICIRNGTRYNRHAFEPAGLTDILVCKHCDAIKGGGVFEPSDSTGAFERDSNGVSTGGASELGRVPDVSQV